MKLISCYVEGYGKIKRKEYVFSKGITTVCKDNGEGKTTLASFIKAMFYGLEGYRKGSTEFCDREHFCPFDDGRFGGNLTFEKDGSVYKIERFFGEKSKTEDSVKLYIDGEEQTTDGEIGKLIFNVDEESFKRTIFLDGNDIEMKSTSGIHAQLNRFLEGGDEDGNLDGALAALEKAAKTYKKSRAGTDKISAETEKIARLNAEIKNASDVKRVLEIKYEKFAALEKEIRGLTTEISQAQRENEKRTQFERYDDMREEVAKAECSLKATLQKYPFGLPTEEETMEINDRLVKEKELLAKANGGEFSAKDREKLSALQNVFEGGAPTEADLLSVERDIKALSTLETEVALAKGQTHNEREKALKGKFALAAPTQKTVDDGEKKVEEYKKLKASYERAPEWLQTEKKEKKSTKKYGAFALLALLVVAVGCALLFVMKGAGIVAIAVGGVALLFDGFVYLNKKSSLNAVERLENPEKRRLEGEIRAKEDEIKATLLPYGYYSGNGVVFDFATLKREVEEYHVLVESEKTREKSILEKGNRAEALAEKLTAFFRDYSLQGDAYIKLLSDLRLSVSDYQNLTAREKFAAQGQEEIARQREENRRKIDAYKQRYGLRELFINGILEDIRACARWEKAIAEGNVRAATYREEKGLNERFEGEKADLNALNRLLNERTEEKSRLGREIETDEAVAEKLDGYQSEKKAAEELLKTYKRKHRLLTAAADLIKTADGRLRDKYVKPVKDEFLRYAEIIEKALGEKVVMTKEFELRFERNGELRSEKHLSAGQRKICALCFRLALLKNMYREELPFLILDDPFATLDKAHMEKVGMVLTELSKDMQMLYFTCHESRII